MSMRGPLTLALFAASVGFAAAPARAAESHDDACSSPCSSPNVVNASAPNVIVEVPPPNVIIRAGGSSECGEREGFVKRCCHFCRPICVQPVAPAYSVQAQAPVMYQAAPVAAPISFQAAPVAAPISFQPAPVAAPISFQAAPVAAPISFQPAPVAAPISFQPAPVAAPIAFQAAPVAFQPAPVAAPVAYQLTPVAANPAPTAPAPTAPTPSAESGITANEALKRITKDVETLTAAVDQHSDYIKIHEMRLLRIEDYLHANPAKDKPFDIITDIDKLKDATKDLPKTK
jgi:hypothetical protein